MNIDLYRHIQNTLIPSLRSESICQLTYALLLDVQGAYNRFNINSYGYLYRANANASAISLEHHINREFDVQATIAELNGSPTDFLVSIDGYVDEVRLRSFIDQWKLFGKSYIFRQADVIFTAQFIDHTCEQTPYDYTAQWIDHQCEDYREVYLTASPIMISGGQNPEWDIIVYAHKAVASVLYLEGTTLFESEHGIELERHWMCPIQKGETFGRSHIGTINEIAEIATYISSCTPDSDAKYDYIFTPKP